MRKRRAVRSETSEQIRRKQLEKREALSYEDVPLEDYEENPTIPKINLNKKTKQIILITVGCIITLLIALNWNNLQPDKVSIWLQDSMLGIGMGKGYPVETQGSTVTQGCFKLIKNDCAIVSDTSFTVLSRTAKEIKNVQHSYNSPQIDVDGSMAIVYNQDGKGYQVESTSKQITKSSTEENIISAAVSNSGTYALVTQSKNYCAQLLVYNVNNQQIYKFYFADCYTTNVALNEEGTQAILSGVKSSDTGELTSIIYILNFNNEEPIFKQEYNNTILYVDYISSKSAVALGVTEAIFIDNNKTSSYNYNNRKVISFNVEYGYGVALALSPMPDGRNCEFVLLGENSNTRFNFQTELKVESISIKDNTIALLSGNKIYAYNPNGNNWNTLDAGQNALKILLYSPSQAYVLGSSDIRSLSLKK